MDDNVVVVRFAEPSRAYEALSVLKRLGDAGDLDVRSAVLLERSADGGYSIPEGADNAAGFFMASGGLIGMLVGVLGGPLGVLLGGSLGALTGGSVEIGRAGDQDVALEGISKQIEPGSTALVAEVTEYTPTLLDTAMDGVAGTVSRRPASDVYAEVEAAEHAEVKGDLDAFKAKIDQDRADRKAKWNAFKQEALTPR
jgi:uncharacterized membrane protein